MSRDPPRSAARRQLPGFLRTAGVGIVCVCVALLFWKQFSCLVQDRGRKEVLQDQTGRLSQQQRQTVLDFAAALERSYGLDLRLEIAPGAPSSTSPEDQTVYLGLFPDSKRAIVVLPNGLETVLPPSIHASLQPEHFDPYWEEGRWPKGLFAWLKKLWHGLPESGSSG